MGKRGMNDPRQKEHRPLLSPKTQAPTGKESRMDPAPNYGLDTYQGYARLKDRVALITGADSGIGRAVALAFAREGAHVAINYLENEKDARETERVVKEAGVRALRVQADISTDAACRRIIILDYATTKGAIVTFTKGLSQSLIERGIRVNCVAPGPVWTPLIVQSFDAHKIDKFGQDSPMGRPAQPAELAPAFVFLACDESSYVNGEILGVTGGKHLA